MAAPESGGAMPGRGFAALPSGVTATRRCVRVPQARAAILVRSTILAWERGSRRPGRIGKTARAIEAFLAEDGG
jgi:hypothetical protein